MQRRTALNLNHLKFYKMSHENTASLGMFDAFINHLDSIFWDGYAEQLANDNPQLYNFEYDQFFTNYV